MDAARPRPARSHLLVVDHRVLDLDAVRAAAAARGWDVALQQLDGTPADAPAPVAPGTFPVPLRLRLSPRPGAAEPDAAVLLPFSRGLALDDLGRRPGR